MSKEVMRALVVLRVVLFFVLTALAPPALAATSNPAWVVGAKAAINAGKEPLAPIVMNYIVQLGQANPSLSSEDLRKKGAELLSYMRESDIPTRERNLSNLTKLMPVYGSAASTAIDLFYDNYLKDDSVGVWNQVTGFSKEVSSTPGFWENISVGARADPSRVGAAIQSFSQTWFDLRIDDGFKQVEARYPAVAGDARLNQLFEQAARGSIDAKELRNGLNREVQQIGTEIKAANLEAKRQREQTQTIYSWVEQQKKVQEVQARREAIQSRFANYEASLSILQTVASMSGASKDLQRGIAAASAVTSLTEQWAIYAATGGSAVVLTGNAVGTYAQLAGLLGGSDQADPTLGLLNQLSSKLDAMREEMRASFSIVNLKLDAVLEQSADIYAQVLRTGIEVEEARASLVELEKSLYAIENQTQRDIRELDRLNSEQASSTCLEMRNLGMHPNSNQIGECLNKLYKNAVERARSPLYMYTLAAEGVATDDMLAVQGALSRGLDQSVGIVQRYRTSTLGLHNTTSTGQVANPALWLASTEAYLRFLNDVHGDTVPKATRRKQLTDMRDEGLTLRQALGELSNIVMVVGEDQKREIATPSLTVAFRYFLERTREFTAAFQNDATNALIENNDHTIFAGQDSAHERDWVGSVSPCSDMAWTPRATFAEFREPLHATLDAQAQSSTPEWIRLRGGQERTGKETTRDRVPSVTVCVSSISEKTDRMVCRGGTYPGGAMPPGAASLRLTYQIRKANFAGIKHSVEDGELETKVLEFPFQFAGGEQCNDGTAVLDFWNRRVASIWPQFLSQLNSGAFGAEIRREIGNVTLHEPAGQLLGWKAALYHLDSGDSVLKALASKMDANRMLVSAYSEIGYPQLYASSGLPLLLNGQANVRVPDTAVIHAIIACYDELGDPTCKDDALRARAVKASRFGLGNTMTGDAYLLESLTSQYRHGAAVPSDAALEKQSYPALDLMVFRLDLAIAALDAPAGPERIRVGNSAVSWLLIAVLAVLVLGMAAFVILRRYGGR